MNRQPIVQVSFADGSVSARPPPPAAGIRRKGIRPAPEILDTEQDQAEGDDRKHELDAFLAGRISRPPGHAEEPAYVHDPVNLTLPM